MIIPNKRDNIFREKVTSEDVEHVLRILKFSGLSDSRVFSARDIHVDNFDEALLYLESLYIPCKAKKYLYGEMTPHRILTVMRQLLRAVGYTIQSHEKTSNGVKEMVYQIVRKVFDAADVPLTMQISFN
jgi:hypothetical protein